MDEILEKYAEGKFLTCLDLIKLLPKTDDLVSNLLNENCLLICESVITIKQNDFDKMRDAQEKLYLFFDKVTSLGIVTSSIPFQLKLTATFNFIFWLLFYNDNDLNDLERAEYLKLILKGLQRVAGNVLLSECSSILDKIAHLLLSLRSLIPDTDPKTGILIIELTTVVLSYIVKLNKTCIELCHKVISVFSEDLKRTLTMVESMNNFLDEVPVHFHLFKFGLNKTATLLNDENSSKADYLYLLESTFLYIMGCYKDSLLCLQKNKNCCVLSLWNYLGALNSYELEHWSLCLGFLNKASCMVLKEDLKARYQLIHGKLNCIKRNHKEATKDFDIAQSLSPRCYVSFCYTAQEYGKMGLHDEMLNSFEKLVEAIKQHQTEEFKPGFENLILNWIHPLDEVTEISALYGLAVSYGLNEVSERLSDKFQKAADMFEKILQHPECSKAGTRKQIIQMPSFLTILHDASIMHLMAGNLVRSEQLALDAGEHYVVKEPKHFENSKLTRDVDWLHNIIEQDLMENSLVLDELKTDIMYSEDLIFIFPQNLISLLIKSEIQGIQDAEEYKLTLCEILSILSSYLSSMIQKEVVDAGQTQIWMLVKALTSKTCVKIAGQLIKVEDDFNVEKMFKRALCCNKGDKDALYNYYVFLMKKGKNREAFKLWRTFFKEKTLVSIDQVQSFALRYFLTNKVKKSDIRKIENQVELNRY